MSRPPTPTPPPTPPSPPSQTPPVTRSSRSSHRKITHAMDQHHHHYRNHHHPSQTPTGHEVQDSIRYEPSPPSPVTRGLRGYTAIYLANCLFPHSFPPLRDI
eukprot:Rmarinus@m.16591